MNKIILSLAVMLSLLGTSPSPIGQRVIQGTFSITVPKGSPAIVIKLPPSNCVGYPKNFGSPTIKVACAVATPMPLPTPKPTASPSLKSMKRIK